MPVSVDLLGPAPQESSQLLICPKNKQGDVKGAYSRSFADVRFTKPSGNIAGGEALGGNRL